MGAGERFPSAPRLGPSNVKEREGEAPRDEAGEPHSPVPLPSGGGFASSKDLLASHSPSFEPSEGERKRRELPVERRDELAVSRSPSFEPHSLLFAARSPEREGLEEWGMRREEEGMGHFELVARRSPSFAYHSLRGTSRSLSFTRLEDWRIPQETQGTSRKSIATAYNAL